jgi:hypothetical protein
VYINNFFKEDKMKTENNVPVQTGKTVRTRKVKLSDDAVMNVKMFACNRLNKAVNAVSVFGNCFGHKYNWQAEQIDIAEAALTTAVKAAMDNLRVGKKIAEAGIKL